MDNKVINLKKVNIEEYRKANPKDHMLIKRISETEAFLLAISPARFSEVDLIDYHLTNGIRPESLEIIPALTPDISFEIPIDIDEDFE